MLSELLATDPFSRILLENSGFSQAQLDTLLLHLRAGRKSLAQKALMRDGGPVSKGSFARTLKQARRRCAEAIYAFILLQYLGLLSPKTLDVLIGVSKTLSEFRGRQLPDEQKSRVEGLVDSAVELLFLADHML